MAIEKETETTLAASDNLERRLMRYTKTETHQIKRTYWKQTIPFKIPYQLIIYYVDINSVCN